METAEISPRLTVVVPFGKEGDLALPFLHASLAQLNPWDKLICVIDSKSDSQSKEAVAQLASLDTRVLSHWASESRSIRDIYFSGYRAALDTESDWVMEMDAGFSHCPSLIGEFRQQMKPEFQYLCSTRLGRGGSHKGPWFRKVLSWAGTRAVKGLFGLRMSDLTGGCHAFQRQALARLVDRGIFSKSPFFQSEVRWFMHSLPWREIPIDYRTDRKFRSFKEIALSTLELITLKLRHSRSPNHLCAVVTTIRPPTAATSFLAHHLKKGGGNLIAIGDRKGPKDYPLSGSIFYDLNNQRDMGFRLERSLPVDHYSRKNLGYLEAIQNRVPYLLDTDDDNHFPREWIPEQQHQEVEEIEEKGWVNVYQHFTPHQFWPRGLPLGNIQCKGKSSSVRPVRFGVIQELVDGDADLDAVHRLVFPNKQVRFRRRRTVALSLGCWSPFNSQATLWFPEAFAYLYLPSHCSFRMTDIWRSFVAQRCLWEDNLRVGFRASGVRQRRNPHCLLQDLEAEWCGQLSNAKFAVVLGSLSITGSPTQKLSQCYRALAAAGLIPTTEIPLVERWCEDYERIT